MLLTFVFFIQVSVSLRGNHQKLGEQCDASVQTDELDSVPQPLEFYERFVKEKKPVVFRGAAKRSRYTYAIH